ncbi:glutathione S-transferase T3-like [Helianthus annuus]|uniref:glutathione S-transferase T3-like n=1 Tax=Helianthus annuus TaxID=4232 RepID=UPI000B9097AE|nr:glutathione S-transferase T3-like [Helianthus annuus]
MSQLQQMQHYQALQQMVQRNSFESLAQFQSQPPTSQPQPPVQLDNDEEVVPESPPQDLKRKKNKGKGKAVETVAETKGDSKPKPRLWTKLEEEALAMVFVKSSTCPIVGNNQTGSSFWKATTERYNGIMEQGPMRDLDSVSGKWRKMSKASNTFSGYYNQIYTNPPSGSNKEDILNLALAKWNSKNSTSFQHLRAWNILKKENKWRCKTSESGSYSAGGSTARCQIDINDDPEFDEEVFPVHESERPTGRDKAKKEAAGKRKGDCSSQTSSGRVRKWTS